MYPVAARAGLIAEGWADSVGSDDACRQVSLKRAETVASYISETLGFPVKAHGMGKSFDPPNNNEVNKQQNRRVVIKTAAPIRPEPETTTSFPKPVSKKRKNS